MIVNLDVKNSVLDMLSKMLDIEDQDTALDTYATLLSDLIVETIKKADVVGVSTTIVGTSPSGPVTGTGTQNNKGTLL